MKKHTSPGENKAKYGEQASPSQEKNTNDKDKAAKEAIKDQDRKNYDSNNMKLAQLYKGVLDYLLGQQERVASLLG